MAHRWPWTSSLLLCALVWTDIFPVTVAGDALGLEQEVRVIACDLDEGTRAKMVVETRLIRRLIGQDDEVVSKWHTAQTTGWWLIEGDGPPRLRRWSWPEGREVPEP